MRSAKAAGSGSASPSSKPRLIEQEPGEIAERIGRARLAGARREPRDQLVVGVEFENPLHVAAHDAVVLAQQPFHVEVHVLLVGDEAHGAFGEALRRAHIAHRIAQASA